MAAPVSDEVPWSLDNLVNAFDFLDMAPSLVNEMINTYKADLEAADIHRANTAKVVNEIKMRADMERQMDYGKLLRPTVIYRGDMDQPHFDVLMPWKRDNDMDDEQLKQAGRVGYLLSEDGIVMRDHMWYDSHDAAFARAHEFFVPVLGMKVACFDFVYDYAPRVSWLADHEHSNAGLIQFVN